MQELVQFELTKEFVERFQKALDERDQKFIQETLQDINPADISALLYEFNSEESKYALNLLPMEVQAEIINDLDPDTR
ncbi:MAG TPA: magnesium transporter, partial [Cyclobacteriaceae bacterium]